MTARLRLGVNIDHVATIRNARGGHAPDPGRAAEIAMAAGAKVLSISDSLVGPVAKASSLVLQVRESEVRNFRSLAASLCVAQSLVIGLAFERERSSSTGRKGRRTP